MIHSRKPEKAFVLRMAPSYVDHVPEGLKMDVLITGWSDASGLLHQPSDWYEFRERVHQACYPGEKDYRRSGGGAGSLWRFIREMSVGDWVVVPYGSEFYVGEVTGEAFFDSSKMKDDSAYRRPVRWLNNKRPISRKLARSSLQSRMKIYHTCGYAKDLIDEIHAVLVEALTGKPSSFAEDLRHRLVRQALQEIQSGKMNERLFEELVASILKSRGATEVKIVPRQQDKGADILATFPFVSSFDIVLAVQAKYYKGEVHKEAVEELGRGMVAEGATFGWVATSGVYCDEAVQAHEELVKEKNFQIELVDGNDLAAMIVDSGVKSIPL
jgi:predicted Mrr-cat superfamily restriction endonuclease